MSYLRQSQGLSLAGTDRPPEEAMTGRDFRSSNGVYIESSGKMNGCVVEPGKTLRDDEEGREFQGRLALPCRLPSLSRTEIREMHKTKKKRQLIIAVSRERAKAGAVFVHFC